MTGVTAEVARLEHAAGVPTRRTPPPRVLGVDGCSTGWAGIVWDGGAVEGLFARRLDGLLDQAAALGVTVAAVDMPLGLPDTGTRRADVEARQALGAKRSSIFLTPTRSAVMADDRAAASMVNSRLGGGGVTAQAYALVPKIREADALLHERHDVTLVEAHPELSFAAMGDGVVLASKRSFAGAARRRALLREHGLDLEAVDLGEVALLAAADDVVDAAAMAWTAMRVASGQAVSRPDPPELFSDAWPAAIWT